MAGSRNSTELNSVVEGPTPADELSLVRDDLPYRLQRRIGLVPHDGSLGVVRRALFWTAVAWLPIVAWAWWTGRATAVQGQTAEPLLAHFGVHARLLFGIPLLIVAEAFAQRVLERQVPQFVRAGLVRQRDLPRFRAILASTARLRGATLPWIVIAGVAVAWGASDIALARVHEVDWASEGGLVRRLGFGGWWYLYVGRAIFVVLLLGWLWRLVLLGVTFARIAKLDLAIVPTHADRAGGLGFVGQFPAAFGPVVFVIALVIGAGWAHDAEYHGLDVHTLYPMMAAALLITLVVFLLPCTMFVGTLGRAKKQALLDYGALVARHGGDVHRKWILGEPPCDEALLSAPELGPVADTAALYQAVQAMRTVPLGKSALLALALPMLAPFIGVLALQIPLKQLLGQLAKGLL